MPGLSGQEQESKPPSPPTFHALQTAMHRKRCLMVEDDYGPWDD